MPRKQIGTWSRKERRWSAMIDGKRINRSCKQLGLPKHKWTKEHSQPVATAYFLSLMAIPFYVGEYEQPQVKVTETAQRRMEVANEYIEVPKNLSPTLVNALFDDQPKTTTNTNLKLSHHLKNLLVAEESKPTTFKTKQELTYWLNRLVKDTVYKIKGQEVSIISADMDSTTINEDTVENFYIWLQAQELESKKKIFGFFKRLVKYLYEKRLIELPRNIIKRWDFDDTTKAILTFTDSEVISVLDGLENRQRLYALLCLNTGMIPNDIANLRQTEKDALAWVNWDKKTITRKRIKHARRNAPTVTYPLWKTTFKLLKELRSNHEKWVLTSKTNTKLIHGSTNVISRQWSRRNLPITLAHFRNIGATKLGTDFKFLPYLEVYLANKPKGITAKHYVPPAQKLVDAMINWLGNQFKQNTLTKKTLK